MLRAVQNPTLVLLQHGQPRATYSLAPGANTLGRAPENNVVCDDASVSRQHASFEVAPDSVIVRDLGSRNGVHVNGVPRREASLQPGDKVRIGTVEFQFAAGFVRPITPPPRKAESAAPIDETRHARAALPDQKQERHLAALYHLCFRVTEGDAPTNAEQQLLDLLLDGVRATLAQYYAPDGSLAFSAAAEKIKGAPKFAAYLLEKFRALPEAAPYTSKDLARYQERLGDWHFLVAPLRTAAGDGAAVIVLARSAGWQEFSTEDRMLLNAATRLWQQTQSRPAGGAPAKKPAVATAAKVKGADAASGLLGDSAALTALRSRLDRVATTRATVLITGETGSGKEVVAQYVHDRSPRAKQPFIKLNCAAIPHTLIESELFGHVKGAFTDAKSDRQGKFQLAHGGTLFLDEIGELPLAMQAKLLRALENGEVERIGSEAPTKVDVRILAATNRDLRAEVKAGRFREDLLYRLEVATVTVPPLREHPEDIPALAANFLEKFCAENGLPALTFAPDALAALQKHSWPGNVRELRNVIQRLAMDASGTTVTATEAKAALGRS